MVNSSKFLIDLNENDEERLPFFMPKLHRANRNGAPVASVTSMASSSTSGQLRQLSLTLPFPPASIASIMTCPPPFIADIVDESLPLHAHRFILILLSLTPSL